MVVIMSNRMDGYAGKGQPTVKRVVLLGLVVVVMLAFVPTPAEAQSQCGWYTDRPYTEIMPKYWCYTPEQGWWIDYAPAQDIAMYRQYGYDAYDGDGVYYLPNGSQPLSRWDDVCGIGLRCSDMR